MMFKPTHLLRRLLALMLAGMDLGMIAVIGIVLLIGIVKKNAIMMVDFAIERRRELLVESDKEVRILEKLRERRHVTHVTDEARQDIKASDEFASRLDASK